MLGTLALNEDFSGILTTATASHFTARAVRAFGRRFSVWPYLPTGFMEAILTSLPRHGGFRTQLPSELFAIYELCYI